jgi:hypothetical protein
MAMSVIPSTWKAKVEDQELKATPGKGNSKTLFQKWK